MRNYWFKILLGAFAIFAIGMVGVTMVRHGIAKVNTVVNSSDPITIPLAFVPFMLSGERLGKLQHLVLYRDSPRQVRGVELAVDVADSLVATGLANCRLTANLETDPEKPGFNVDASKHGENTFSCLPGDSVPSQFVPFGEAVFQPGEVRVPLFIEQEVVNELNEFAADSTSELAEEQADSLADLADVKSDSAIEAAIRSADSLGQFGRRIGDSLRAAARQHMDSVRAEMDRMADSTPGR